MIPECEDQPRRNLFAAIALSALLDHHELIKRAKRLGRQYDIDRELAAARTYINGGYFAQICERAGMGEIRPDIIMEKLEAGTMQFGDNAGADWYRKGDAA